LKKLDVCELSSPETVPPTFLRALVSSLVYLSLVVSTWAVLVRVVLTVNTIQILHRLPAS
jgi:hypothetical protein